MFAVACCICCLGSESSLWSAVVCTVTVVQEVGSMKYGFARGRRLALACFSLVLLGSTAAGPARPSGTAPAGFVIPTHLFDASVNLKEILGFIAVYDQTSNDVGSLDCIDLFAGKQMFANRCRAANLRVEAYDIMINSSHDFTSRAGWFYALCLVLRLVPYGLLLAGPPCSLWIYMSKSFHGRSKTNPGGLEFKDKVAASNLLVSNLAVLIAIAISRKIFALIEQPGSSIMPLYGYWARLRALFKSIWKREWTWMIGFGHPMPKPSVLWTNLWNSRRLKRTWNKVKWLQVGRRDLARGKALLSPGKIKRKCAAATWFCLSLLFYVFFVIHVCFYFFTFNILKCCLSNCKAKRAYRARVTSKIYTFISKTGWLCGGKDLAGSAGYTR
jgi:hypothetical protein